MFYKNKKELTDNKKNHPLNYCFCIIKALNLDLLDESFCSNKLENPL